MRRLTTATAALSLSLALHLAAFGQQVDRPRLAGEDFERRFKQSYLAVSSVEPKVTDIEREILEKLSIMIERNSDHAKAFLSDILGDDKPVSAAFNHALGNLYYESNDFLQAEIEYQKAIDKHESFQRAWNGLGLARYQQTDYEGALEALSRSVKLGARDALTYGLLGFCHLQAGNYRSAETAYHLATLNDAENTDWAEGIAQIYMETGRYEQAVSVFDEIIRDNPDNVEFWLHKANAWLELDEPLKTARCIEIARRLGKIDADTLYLLGNVYLKEGVFERAQETFLATVREGGQIDPFEALQAARFLVNNDEPEMARTIFRRIEAVEAGWGEADEALYQRLAGEFAFEDGDYETAREAFLKALGSDPFNGRILLKLAEIHAMDGAYEKAVVYFDRAAFDPRAKYAALVNKGMLMINRKQYAMAVSPIEQAMKLKDDPKLVKLHAQLQRIVEEGASVAHVP